MIDGSLVDKYIVFKKKSSVDVIAWEKKLNYPGYYEPGWFGFIESIHCTGKYQNQPRTGNFSLYGKDFITYNVKMFFTKDQEKIVENKYIAYQFVDRNYYIDHILLCSLFDNEYYIFNKLSEAKNKSKYISLFI